MRGDIYEYDTMPDAKKLFAAMKKQSKDERAESIFYAKQKDKFLFWLSWYFGTSFDIIVEYENENDNNAGVVTDETQELRQEQTPNED